jgi:hypothetical protein
VLPDEDAGAFVLAYVITHFKGVEFYGTYYRHMPVSTMAAIWTTATFSWTVSG